MNRLWIAYAMVQIGIAMPQTLVTGASAQGVCGEWETFPRPVPPVGDFGGSQFRDVVAIAPDDAWAVGYVSMGSPTWEWRTLAMHWDGVAWSIVTTPNPSPSINTLDAVAVVAADDIWAAGVKELYTPFGTLLPLILHWDGVSWTEVTDSALDLPSVALLAVEAVGADDIWFGGDSGTTIHWDGSNFEVFPVETFDTGNCSGTYGCGHAVEAFAVIAPDDAWAVGGANDSDYSYVSQIWHWDGTQWSHTPGPTIAYEQRLFGVVALASNDVWAVGDVNAADPGDNDPLVVHWDGVQWTRVPVPGYAHPVGSLQDVIALAPDDIWAAGIYTEQAPPSPGLPLTIHYDGVTWSEVLPDPNGPSSAWLRGLTSATGCDLWSVGSSNGEPHVQRFHPLTPSLRLASIGTGDSCPGGPGDANLVWEPGEQITIPVTITAFSGGFTGVTGTLSTTSPGITILDGSANWPAVIAGQSVVTEAPHFVIAIDPAVPCQTTVAFDLTIDAAEGGPFTETFDHQIGDVLILSGPGGLIPNYDPTGLTSPLNVTQDVTLTDLDVRVNIDHNYVGDLKVEIESPAGTRITLLDRPGVPATWFGCSDDDMDVTFDDSSTYDLETHCAGTTPWYVGAAAPVQPLSAFDGESTAGTWKLIVSDHLTGNAGSLLSWQLMPTPPLGGNCNVCTSEVTSSGVTADAGVFSLAPPRPSPFRASSEMVFTLDRAGHACLDIFDVRGRRVVTLLDRDLAVGRHSLVWNGTDSDGRPVAAGTYFVRLTSGGRTDLGKVVRLR